VKHGTLGDYGKFERGDGLPKSDLADSAEIGAIHYGQIHTRYGYGQGRPYRSLQKKNHGNIEKQDWEIL